MNAPWLCKAISCTSPELSESRERKKKKKNNYWPLHECMYAVHFVRLVYTYIKTPAVVRLMREEVTDEGKECWEEKGVCVCVLSLESGNTPALSQRACSIFSAEFKDRMQKTPVERQYRPCGKWPLQPFYPSRPLLERSGMLVASPLTLGRCVDSHSGSHAPSTPARVDGQSHVCEGASHSSLQHSALL